MKKTLLFLLTSICFLSSSTFADVDPYQNMNEKTHNFNQTLDKQVASPVARLYKNITPDFIERGITNFTHNIEDLSIGLNNILQGKFNAGMSDFLRFTLNSSVGLAGFVDVASHLGLVKHDEDFGQTLAVWGVGSGCYVVLPVLGPSTIRDTAGSFANVLGGDPWYNASAHGNNEYLDKSDYMLTKTLTAVDFRSKNLETFDNLEKNSLDFYASVKSLYIQDRNRKIANTKPTATIEILYEGDWEEIDTQ